jgi:hypothetical protein
MLCRGRDSYQKVYVGGGNVQQLSWVTMFSSISWLLNLWYGCEPITIGQLKMATICIYVMQCANNRVENNF